MRPAFCTRFTHIRARNTDEIRQGCLSLMRATAQSVSVITTLLPPMKADHAHSIYHGATLSSFTSIAMYPHPLVSFSLRTPSQLAESLHHDHSHVPVIPHMVINLLSATQAHLAVQFSRPREDPFASASYSLSPEGIPILQGCLGALSCTLVGSVSLGGTSREPSGGDTPLQQQREEQGSELFVARVHRVEKGSSHETGSAEPPLEHFDQGRLPLVYYHQNYVTIDPARRLTASRTSPFDSNKPKA